MKNKFKIILALSCMSFLFAGAACKELTEVEKYEQQGYKISVTYDANGGSFLNRPGITIMDMFDPNNHQKDDEGEIHIKLTEPTSSTRPTSGSDAITLTKPNHFFAGWYETRTLKLVNGSPIDENGRALKKEGDIYVYAELAENEEKVSVTPVYEYDDYWDFETDTIDYKESDGTYSMTLYAGWVQYYEFNYYYQKDGAWEKIESSEATTAFDYKTTNAEGSTTHDKDTIWLPQWKNGAMNHEFSYANGSSFSFPKIEGTTFSKAYLDAECTQEITTATFEHQGTLDLETCTAVNRVQNIYITLEKGEHYKIETAQQLIDNANLQGIYEIKADLDFSQATKEWPLTFITGTFTGKMYASEGQSYALKNINAKHSHSSATVGGVFGEIAKGALIENLSFENVTYDLAYTGQRLRDTSFGLFAGNIDDEANIVNVSVGGTFKIGKITLGDGYKFNLYAKGNTSGLTKNAVVLQIYGVKLGEQYEFSVLPYDKTDAEKKTVTIDEEYDISLTFDTSEMYDEEIYNIDYNI